MLCAEFITSQAVYNEKALPALPQFCIVGRSNVGKSSLINMLSGQNKLARTSSTPGRTQLINVFLFEKDKEQKLLIDLPGYGYANVSKQKQNSWQQMLEEYLLTSKALQNIILLVDSRHEPTTLDQQMVKFLYFNRLPFVIVATKADKLKKSQYQTQRALIANTLKVGQNNVILTSAETALGKSEIEKILF